jgi:hypothetical protein
MGAPAEPQTVPRTADETAAPQITEPGVYPDLPEDLYHQHPALSSSGARRLLAPSCPAKFKYARDHGEPHKPVYDLGKAAHKLALGAGAEIEVVDADSWRTSAAKAQRDQAYDEGRTPLLAHEFAVVEAMAAALKAHPTAGRLFTADRGQPEQSLFWTDRQTGVFCRARLDWFPVRGNTRLIVPDYKTAASAEPEAFQRSAYDKGYFIQAAFYLAAVKALGLAGDQSPRFVFVAQEKEAPYVVSIFDADSRFLSAGKQDMRVALQVYAECLLTDEWPPYSNDVIPLSLPGYAERRYDFGEFL